MVLHAPTRAGSVIVGYQHWRDLLFIHWRVRAAAIGPARGRAAPSSLEAFLVERYRLYSRALGPVLWHGPVRHEPWSLADADVAELNEDLSAAAGMRPLGRPHSCQWSPGVSVAFE